jgi:hypothetical protein
MIADNNLKSKKPLEIGILEIRRHVPVLYTFCKICKTNNTNVTVFTTADLFSRLETYLKDKNHFNFVIKDKKESIHHFLKRVKIICNEKIDLLFINTIHETIIDLIEYISFDIKSKTILVVHHVNAWLRPRLVLNPKHVLRTIDTNFSSVLIKKFIFPKFDAINVIYSPVKEYIMTNMEFNKEIFTLPTSIYEEKSMVNKEKNNSKLKVVIPGLIQEHRKDFTTIFPAFENLFKRHQEKLRLCLLGMPVGRYGELILKKFKKMKKRNNEVILFDSFVKDDVFEKELKESDIILTPMRIKTRADNDIEEEYGKTVGSGIIYNAIQYAKPIIAPNEFHMLRELKSSSLQYNNSKDLEAMIDELITISDKLKFLKEEALKNAQKFSLENLQNYFEKNVLGWLQKN